MRVVVPASCTCARSLWLCVLFCTSLAKSRKKSTLAPFHWNVSGSLALSCTLWWGAAVCQPCGLWFTAMGIRCSLSMIMSSTFSDAAPLARLTLTKPRCFAFPPPVLLRRFKPCHAYCMARPAPVLGQTVPTPPPSKLQWCLTTASDTDTHVCREPERTTFLIAHSHFRGSALSSQRRFASSPPLFVHTEPSSSSIKLHQCVNQGRF